MVILKIGEILSRLLILGHAYIIVLRPLDFRFRMGSRISSLGKDYNSQIVVIIVLADCCCDCIFIHCSITKS